MSRRLAAVAQALLSSLVVTTVPMGAGAQVEAPFQNREEREIYGDTNGSGSILDAANPMDLLNQIRRATAMDDARRIWVNKSMGLAASRIEPLPLVSP